MKHLNQDEATQNNLELLNKYQLSVYQLTELVGLSFAHCIANCYPTEMLNSTKVLLCCGPGYNGADGLVAARHLASMKYEPVIYYPMQNANTNLMQQYKPMGIKFLSNCPKLKSTNMEFGLIVDSLFGCDFEPPVHKSFVSIIDLLKQTTVPIASIDIPSGWSMRKGPEDDDCIKPELLFTLTAAKMCVQYFNGKFHFLGGRYIPRALQEKYQLNLIDYKGTEG